MDAPNRETFAVERAEVREGIQLAYVREGAGGYPLLLVHGWPETKRIWWRNIRPLAEAGFSAVAPPRERRRAADYFARRGRDADALAAELAFPAQRRRYVAEFYGHRFWAAPGTFTRAEVDFLTEPFADAARLRAGWGNYESALGTRPLSEPPRFFEVSAVPTLALYGPEDHVIWRQFPQMCEVAFSALIGPFVVQGAGHFLQWERATLLNRTIEYFLRDLQ